jgi:ABC-2 type transport system permease protein
MTTTTARPRVIRRSRLVWELLDAVAIAERNLRAIRRHPDQLLDVTLQPIVFVLIFGVVFGGALQAATGGNYINFLMAGIFVQTAIFGAMTTGLGLAEDLQKGLLDRFRSLPMGRSSVMVGRAISDLVRLLAAIVVMVVTGVLIGFAPGGDPADWMLGLGLLLAFAFAVSWIAIAIALLLWRNPLAVQGVAFVVIFPLVFLSSAFVPAATLPGWLRAFAANQPVSVLIDTLRALMLGQPVGNGPILVVVWTLAFVAVGIPLSARLYRRMEKG